MFYSPFSGKVDNSLNPSRGTLFEFIRKRFGRFAHTCPGLPKTVDSLTYTFSVKTIFNLKVRVRVQAPDGRTFHWLTRHLVESALPLKLGIFAPHGRGS